MEPADLLHVLRSNTQRDFVPDEAVAERFSKYPRIALEDGRELYLFTHERQFRDREHIVELHGRNNPAIPLHIYHYVVLTYCYSGHLTIETEADPVELDVGDCVILDRHAPHGVRCTGEDDFGVNIILSDDYFGHLAAAGLERMGSLSPFARQIMTNGATHVGHMVFRTSGDSFVRELVDRILCENLDPAGGSHDIIDGLIGILLIQLVRSHATDLRVPDESERRSRLVGDIREWVVLHYRDGSLSQMAADLGYESTYLSSLVRKCCGRTFKQLVNIERMRQAAVLLAHTAMPVYEVASEVGISNLTSFYRRFSEYADCTPADYRAKSRQDS